MQSRNTFAKTANLVLYKTSNKEYGGSIERFYAGLRLVEHEDKN